MACTDDVRAGLYYLRCYDFKELLASSAEAQALKLIDQIRRSLRLSNTKVTEEYQLMAVELLKVCHNTEEVIALKKYIQKAQQDQDKMREIIHQNKNKDEFLMAYRFEALREYMRYNLL